MSTVLGLLVVLVLLALLSHSSPPRVSLFAQEQQIVSVPILTVIVDAKQARDLVNVLAESKQKIDPRLAEMARYGGGGGGRGGYGRGRGGGGRGGNFAFSKLF
jgi:hypothetical protein